MLGIEPSLRAPEARVLPVYYIPKLIITQVLYTVKTLGTMILYRPMNNQIVINKQLISYKSVNNLAGHNGAVVFLHGWRSEGNVWNGVLDSLSSKLLDKNIAFLTIDLPGFGSSQNPQQNFDINNYAEVVKGFIDKLELKQVIIVGHSFGGRVGIKLAFRYPELISRLILVDSAGFAMNSRKKSILGTIAKIVRPMFRPVFMRSTRKMLYKLIGAEDYLATLELQQTFVNIVNEDLSEDMKRVQCPTLIITGEKDSDTPVEFGKRMHKIISNSKFVVLRNAGHFSFLDNKDEFVNEVASFIN